MEPLSIDEILDETNQIDISARQKHWIITEVSFCFFVFLELSALITLYLTFSVQPLKP